MQKLTLNQLQGVGEITSMFLHPCANRYLVEIRTKRDRYRLVDNEGMSLLVAKGESIHTIVKELATASDDHIERGYVHEPPELIH